MVLKVLYLFLKNNKLEVHSITYLDLTNVIVANIWH